MLLQINASLDKKRVQKSLHTGHPLGCNPMLGSFADEKAEAEMIAREIKRCTANMGGVLNWGDFAILRKYLEFPCAIMH